MPTTRGFKGMLFGGFFQILKSISLSTAETFKAFAAVILGAYVNKGCLDIFLTFWFWGEAKYSCVFVLCLICFFVTTRITIRKNQSKAN